jgi:hypothetical protein
MEVPINHQFEINVENTKVVCLAKKASATTRTKHINILYHFIREHVNSGKIRIKFFPTEDNTADIMRKNFGWKIVS